MYLQSDITIDHSPGDPRTSGWVEWLQKWEQLSVVGRGWARVGDTGGVSRRTTVTFSVLAVVLVLAAGCGGSAGPGDDGSRAQTEVELVGPDEFASRLGDPDAVVVNVHTPYEGEIAGTDLFVPFDQVRSSDALPDDRDRPLLVYCRSGNMSAEATAELTEAGYRDVTDLAGGMVAWEAAGRAVEIVPEHRGEAVVTG